MKSSEAVLAPFMLAPAGGMADPNPRTALFATLMSISEGWEVPYMGDPVSKLYMPLFDKFNATTRQVVGVMSSIIHWRSYLTKILPDGVNGIDVILHYECNGIKGTLVRDADKNAAKLDSLNYELHAFTYQIHGPEAKVVGYGDHHDKGFQEWERRGDFIDNHLVDGTESGTEVSTTCTYHVHLFPTKTFYNLYHSYTPLIITLSMAGAFIFSIFMFLCYDGLVERRQKIILAKAKKSTAIVSSLFPKNVRDKLLETDEDTKKKAQYGTNKNRLKGFLDGGKQDDNEVIADLFPNCTVFFGDIAGFTAWSSTREPAQVFILLQQLYQAFDLLAKRRRVFKVETIGDSYVAVTGLPEPQDKHALTIVRFAWDCLMKVSEVTTELESTLGPDTGTLTMRFGLHSGPVTAGVLRGDRARFQLFGDTVNTASRMESTGVKGRIQVSHTTAAILKESGKQRWLIARKDNVEAKGLGVLQTYFVNPTGHKGSSITSDSASDSNSRVLTEPVFKPTTQRLVDWLTEIMAKDIKKIIHARMHKNTKDSDTSFVYRPQEGSICLDEVKRCISMPEYNAAIATCTNPHDEIVVDQLAVDQLRELVMCIAALYRNNPFHAFEHACHATMSVKKLLGRVVAPELTQEQMDKLANKNGERNMACQIHEFTYGINAEPLALLALTFSSIIHDVDHRGVSNAQLAVEEPELAAAYRQISIAEQHSVTVAWDLFMEDRFDHLRQVIFASEQELLFFRQLVVNVVLATDIFDKDLNAMRKSRWEEAFASIDLFDPDLRATIVLEHIMQASDVSHTMQHWCVYQKWNRCLFLEMHAAFKSGRLAKDPATFWYKGELGFFDNYIIPLALKLKECNVFGVYSDEYLNYAKQNRAEWEARGKDLLAEMVASLE